MGGRKTSAVRRRSGGERRSVGAVRSVRTCAVGRSCGIATAPWTQTQLQELIAWQQSAAPEWCECAGLPDVGVDGVAPSFPWEWQWVVPALVAMPAWTDAIAGPASSRPVPNCQSSRRASTAFSFGRHNLMAARLDHDLRQ